MRFEELTEEQMTDAQKKVYHEVCAGPRGRLGPPTAVALHSPGLADRVQRLGEYIRFGSTLPERIMEFVVLMTAFHLKSPYIWQSHRRNALKAGLSESIADELAQGRRPANMGPEEAAAYDFCTELMNTNQSSDATFGAARDRFGKAGVVDMLGVIGYYTVQCYAVNVNQKSVPPGTPQPF
jgi:4-carboxymuconolactone decarboxylase